MDSSGSVRTSYYWQAMVAPPLGWRGRGEIMYDMGSAEMASMRLTRKPLRRIEILGLIIFILMVVVMLAVGALLFCDWLDAPGSAPAGSPADPGPVSTGLSIAGAIPLIPFVVGVEVAGALSLALLYLVSALGRRR